MRIDSFSGQWAFLSNFEPPTVWMSGREVVVEVAFQAQKTLVPAEWCQFLAPGLTPGQAKRLGRKVTLRPDWEQVKVNVMRDLLEAKFGGRLDGRDLLLSTGDAELIEGNNWHDTFWGQCKCPIHQGHGLNVLGTLLMEVRDDIRD